MSRFNQTTLHRLLISENECSISSSAGPNAQRGPMPNDESQREALRLAASALNFVPVMGVGTDLSRVQPPVRPLLGPAICSEMSEYAAQ